MKKKSIFSIIVIAMVIALMAGATMSWFTGSATVKNTFTAGTVAITADNGVAYSRCLVPELAGYHWNPGDTTPLPLNIVNTGSKSICLRFKADCSWISVSGKPDLSANNVTFKTLSSNWKLWKGYYYYRYPVDGSIEKVSNPKAENPNLQVILDGPSTNDYYQGRTLQTTITVEAIQSSNDAAWYYWGVNPTDLFN